MAGTWKKGYEYRPRRESEEVKRGFVYAKKGSVGKKKTGRANQNAQMMMPRNKGNLRKEQHHTLCFNQIY